MWLIYMCVRGARLWMMARSVACHGTRLKRHLLKTTLTSTFFKILCMAAAAAAAALEVAETT